MNSESSVAVAPPPQVKKVRRKKTKPKRQPRYHVLLWNDDDHSYDYVIRMMQELFGHPPEKGLRIADEVHYCGRAICLTTTKEHAELKREQIHAYGRDKKNVRCAGSMWSTIEAELQ